MAIHFIIIVKLFCYPMKIECTCPVCLHNFFTFYYIDPSGWWTGKIGRKEGLFPSNYVEEV